MSTLKNIARRQSASESNSNVDVVVTSTSEAEDKSPDADNNADADGQPHPNEVKTNTLDKTEEPPTVTDPKTNIEGIASTMKDVEPFSSAATPNNNEAAAATASTNQHNDQQSSANIDQESTTQTQVDEESPSISSCINHAITDMMNNDFEPSASVATPSNKNEATAATSNIQQNANKGSPTTIAPPPPPNNDTANANNATIEEIIPKPSSDGLLAGMKEQESDNANISTNNSSANDIENGVTNQLNAQSQEGSKAPTDVKLDSPTPKIPESNHGLAGEKATPTDNEVAVTANDDNNQGANPGSTAPTASSGLAEKANPNNEGASANDGNHQGANPVSTAPPAASSENANASNASIEETNAKLSNGLAEKEVQEPITANVTENKAAEAATADSQKVVDSNIPASNPQLQQAEKESTATIEINPKSSSDGLAEKEHQEPTTEHKAAVSAAAAADAEKVARSRARSLSSAVSSISEGGDSITGDNHGLSLGDPMSFDNNGKTPLRTNAGPVRKRHKKKQGPRALFRESSTEGQQPCQDLNPNSDSLPPLDGEGGMSSSVTFARRARSNTIDSFRAAMDSSQLSFDLPTESIVLPEMKNDSSELLKDDDEDDDDAKKVEDLLGSSTNNNSSNLNPLTSPRSSRSDTIDFHSNNNPLTSPRSRSDTIDYGIPLTSRSRSDTIDFLTSAVEFQVLDNEESGTVNDMNMMDEIPHPTPINVTKEVTTTVVAKELQQTPTSIISKATTSESCVTTATITKKVEINLDHICQRSHNHESKSQSQGNGDSASKKGHIAFGKTPKKTNRSRAASHASFYSEASQGPLRKRHRTGSLSFALSDEHESASKAATMPVNTDLVKKEEKEESTSRVVTANHDVMNEDDIPTECSDNNNNSTSSGGMRSRSNTLESFHIHNAVYGVSSNGVRSRSDTLDLMGIGQRSRSDTLDHLIGGGRQRARSDTLDFLTAAVAGDMGHDLDAAIAAAADDGASFAMHNISAPSGASARYTSQRSQNKRPRSDTLDSTASSINSAKLDFFVSVAAEQGALSSDVQVGGGLQVHQHQRERTESLAGGSENSSTHSIPPQRRPRSNTLEIYSNMNAASSSPRARSDTVDFLIGGRARSDTVDFLIGANDEDGVMANIDDVVTLPYNGDDENDTEANNSNVLDHLKALCDEPKIKGSKTARILRRKRRLSSDIMADNDQEGTSTANKKQRKNSEATWKSYLQDSMMDNSLMANLSRNRLESWGGMSDLSQGMGAVAGMHTALRDTGILDDILGAAADLGENLDGISSGASSLERTKQKNGRTTSSGSNSLNGGVATSTATTAQKKEKRGRPRMDSIGALSLASLSDDASISIAGPKGKPPAKKSDASASIVVDYDAIAAAVHAANAATDGLDISAILGRPTSKSELAKQKGSIPQNLKLPPTKYATPHPKSYLPYSATKPPSYMSQSQKKAPPKPPLVTFMTPQAVLSGSNILPKANAKSPVPFPVTSINIPLVPIPKSTKTKEEMDAIRERARALAGYVHPGAGGKTPAKRPPPPRKTPSASKYNPHFNPPYRTPGMPPHIPINKRGMPGPSPRTPMPDHIRSNNAQTPLSYMIPPAHTPSSTYSAKSGTLQSQQKWDDMFDCLVQFIEQAREKAMKNLNEEQKAAWIWDGNVPTSYKTPCGKALGRWINNQRSAKAKGTLKDDREVRLVSTGLKWSVLTTNSWRQMLRELEIYVNEQTKDGRTWDGNVPTNYKIKSNIPSAGGADDEEKNLGRWVNRQRSLFQGGKLKKDRQQDLERIGLKWSVLLTTSWSTMYDSLCAYAEEKRNLNPHGWDGNVPANFKTRSSPPLSLGRWVNRQRSAHAKGRLKEEYVRKLQEVGLKWVIHARTGRITYDDDDDFVGGEFIQDNLIQKPAALAPPTNNGAAVSLNGNNTAQTGSSISNNVVLLPLGDAYVTNDPY